MLYLKIVPILMIIPAAIIQVSGQCSQNKYGPDCRYDCHCEPDVACHFQTGCNGNCAEGWDGTTCQRQNVALNKPTKQSTTQCGERICFNSSYAVDGSIDQTFTRIPPCTHTTPDEPAYWTVTLDRVYNIYSFKIYNRNEIGCDVSGIQCGNRLNNFVLSVGNTSTQNYQICYEDTTNTQNGPGSTIEKTCNRLINISGDSVKISLNTGQPLALCEVLLYVCSSGWYGELCDQPCGHCWNGNVCDKENGVCPVTPGNPTCAAGHRGDKCTSTCTAGEYGPDCKDQCGSCANGTTVCNTTTGECPVRPGLPTCKAGYIGLKCDQACAVGEYGPDCTDRCGSCANGTTGCNTTTGKCPVRPGLQTCMAGYTGLKCDQGCSDGMYGVNCQSDCGHCYNGAACDKSSGECPLLSGKLRCDPGYLERNCSVACPGGTFGNLCEESCGQCVDGNLTCDHRSGVCPNCAAGWQGNLCKQKKANPTPVSSGLIGGIAGGTVGGIVLAVVVVAVIVMLYRRKSKRKVPTEIQSSTEQPNDSVMNISHSSMPITPDSTSTSDEPNYYNMAQEDDHEYERVFANEYSKIGFSQLEKESHYSKLS